jgi:hypothetical protein
LHAIVSRPSGVPLIGVAAPARLSCTSMTRPNVPACGTWARNLFGILPCLAPSLRVATTLPPARPRLALAFTASLPSTLPALRA